MIIIPCITSIPKHSAKLQPQISSLQGRMSPCRGSDMPRTSRSHCSSLSDSAVSWVGHPSTHFSSDSPHPSRPAPRTALKPCIPEIFCPTTTHMYTLDLLYDSSARNNLHRGPKASTPLQHQSLIHSPKTGRTLPLPSDTYRQFCLNLALQYSSLSA